MPLKWPNREKSPLNGARGACALSPARVRLGGRATGDALRRAD